MKADYFALKFWLIAFKGTCFEIGLVVLTPPVLVCAETGLKVGSATGAEAHASCDFGVAFLASHVVLLKMYVFIVYSTQRLRDSCTC